VHFVACLNPDTHLLAMRTVLRNTCPMPGHSLGADPWMEAGMLPMIAKLLPVAILILWCLSASSFACNLPDNKLQGSLLFLPVLHCSSVNIFDVQASEYAGNHFEPVELLWHGQTCHLWKAGVLSMLKAETVNELQQGCTEGLLTRGMVGAVLKVLHLLS
jgi:hypothetical protein